VREAVMSEPTIKVGGITHFTEGINMKVGCTSNRRLTKLFTMTFPYLLSNVSTSLLLEALIAKFDNGLSLDEIGSAK